MVMGKIPRLNEEGKIPEEFLPSEILSRLIELEEEVLRLSILLENQGGAP